MADAPLADLLEEARRIAAAAREAGVALRIAGGVAVALRCPSAMQEPLRRTYADVDAIGLGRERGAIMKLLGGLGYQSNAAFDALHCERRLLLWDEANARQLDLFFDSVEFCHAINLAKRVVVDELTLPLADLLLMKLQVFETNHKDFVDILALLTDHEFTEDEAGINLAYLADLTARDWGLWRTTTMIAERARVYARELPGFEHVGRIEDQVGRYLETLQSSPKRLSWKTRAVVGERVRWYMLPEENQ